MTVPNKLTLSRLVMAPLVFLSWYLFIELDLASQFGIIIFFFLFLLSEISDVADGRIARKRGQISDVGKLMDPFSDVFFRLTYFVCFLGAGLMPPWVLVIILWRELSIMFIRMLLAREGATLAAGLGGKFKSLLYFVSGLGGMTVLFLRIWSADFRWLSQTEFISSLLFALAALASLVSFVDYFRVYLKTETHRRFVEG